jgi:hypothetical protein
VLDRAEVIAYSFCIGAKGGQTKSPISIESLESGHGSKNGHRSYEAMFFFAFFLQRHRWWHEKNVSG